MYTLILGANSDIAKAIAHQLARDKKYNFYLASRNLNSLNSFAATLQSKYAVKAIPLFFDAVDFSSHQAFYNNLDPKPTLIILAFGQYLLQKDIQGDFQKIKTLLDVNFTGAVSILEIIRQDLLKRQKGTIVGISSIAGIRGRKSNYLYGATKAALTTYLSGLRNELAQVPIPVITVIPGYVATKMTHHLNLPSILTAKPDDIASKIISAIDRGKNVTYCKKSWYFFALIIKLIPEFIFKKTSL